MLIIIHYRIISYMNVFFTCKNTLVILLQLYRLNVVQSENRKTKKKIKINSRRSEELTDVYVISGNKHKKRRKRAKDESEDDCDVQKKKSK